MERGYNYMDMNISKLLNPKTVALVGISKSNNNHPANVIYHKNQKKGSAEIFLVNPSGGTYDGKTIYTSIKEIPQKIDAVVIVVRSEYVHGVMKDAIDSDTGGAIVISGGFSETGNHTLQEELVSLAREHNYPFIGPNGLGIYSPPMLNSLFFSDERFVDPPLGGVSLISQSGGVLVDAIISFTFEDVGIARVVSMGNKALIDEVDLINYLSEDNETRVIGIYTEGFPRLRGRDFIEAVNKSRKPVVMWKAGKTPASSSAISSHTAAVAGDYTTFHEVLKSTPAIEVDTMPEFLSACEALSRYDRMPLENIGIVTMSGGHGVIVTDFLYDAGFTIPPYDSESEKRLRSSMSPGIGTIASFSNPIDLTGSALDDDYLNAVTFSLEQEEIDALLLLFLPFIPAITSALPPKICQAARQSTKPVVCYVPQLPKFQLFTQGFESRGIPVSHTLEGTITMLKAIRNDK
jgi:acyl-CoA synthetase (NDP forming)